MSRSSFYSLISFQKDKQALVDNNVEEDRYIVEKIKQVAGEHPYWGYRRICAWLNHRKHIKINKKKVYRLMREINLCVNQKVYKAKRKIDTTKPKPIRPNEWWGIDMTKFLIPSVGWVYFVVLLDWFNKKVLGWHVGLQARSKEWIQVLLDAVMSGCPEGSREYEINLMSDNGSQPTSRAFMKECALLGIKQAFTSYDNPKGNADTERFIRTLKEELIWFVEFESVEQAKQMISDKIEEYNQEYVHSALGYLSPEEFTQRWTQGNIVYDSANVELSSLSVVV